MKCGIMNLPMIFFLLVVVNTKSYTQTRTTNSMDNVYYKTIDVSGLEIFYIEAGDKAKPTLLLLHGFPSSSFMFRHLISDLKDRYHLIAPTYPGFGLSSMPSIEKFDYSFDNLSVITEKFIDVLGIKKASFFMHDYGGPIGFRILMRRPELLECLIIQNANAYKEGLTESSQPLFNLWERPTDENKNNVAQLLTIDGTKFQYYDGVSDSSKIDPSAIYTDQYFLDRAGNKEIQLALLYDYRNNVEVYDLWQKQLTKIQPPTLIVWGEKDKFFSKKGALKYGEDLKDVEFNFYPTGHFPLEEFHADIAHKIDDFLSRKLSL